VDECIHILDDEMHSQEQISLLLQHPIVQELIDILENEGSSVLKQLDFSSINTVFVELKTSKRGRPYLYDPDEKLKAFLYGLAEGKRTIRGISRCIQTSVAQMFLHLNASMSYATLDRFWHQLSEVAEQVFEQLVEHIKQLGVLGNYQAADTTSIATPWLDDPDATWSFDATKKKYYFGYGLLLVVDVATEIPIAARFIKRKQALKKDCVQVIQKAFSVKKPRVFLADAGFDFIDFQQHMMKKKILPIVTYNPRNAGKLLPITYRVEHLVKQRATKVTFDQKKLKKTFRKRSSVENTNNVLKQLGLEDLRVKGWYAVKTHVFLILILRLAIAIARYQKNNDCNLRRISIGE
jgi:transposase